MSDEDRSIDAARIEQASECFGDAGHRHRLERRAFAVAGRIPGKCTVARREVLEIAVERAAVGADAV
jgi:hypothetical protein